MGGSSELNSDHAVIVNKSRFYSVFIAEFSLWEKK